MRCRAEQYTTCEADRPLFVQFCANDPDTLLAAARHVEGTCDYVDLNFGCPQRIAKRGNYGAFLMDDIPRVESLISTLHKVRPRPAASVPEMPVLLCGHSWKRDLLWRCEDDFRSMTLPVVPHVCVIAEPPARARGTTLR